MVRNPPLPQKDTPGPLRRLRRRHRFPSLSSPHPATQRIYSPLNLSHSAGAFLLVKRYPFFSLPDPAVIVLGVRARGRFLGPAPPVCVCAPGIHVYSLTLHGRVTLKNVPHSCIGRVCTSNPPCKRLLWDSCRGVPKQFCSCGCACMYYV